MPPVTDHPHSHESSSVAEPQADSPRDVRTEDIVQRLRSVEGHVRGVERMVQKDAYCIDVMNQIQAVQKALERISGLVLDRHLHSCVTQALRGNDPMERERVIGEVMEVFRTSGRR